MGKFGRLVKRVTGIKKLGGGSRPTRDADSDDRERGGGVAASMPPRWDPPVSPPAPRGDAPAGASFSSEEASPPDARGDKLAALLRQGVRIDASPAKPLAAVSGTSPFPAAPGPFPSPGAARRGDGAGRRIRSARNARGFAVRVAGGARGTVHAHARGDRAGARALTVRGGRIARERGRGHTQPSRVVAAVVAVRVAVRVAGGGTPSARDALRARHAQRRRETSEAIDRGPYRAHFSFQYDQ